LAFDIQSGPGQTGKVLSRPDSGREVLLVRWDRQKWKEWEGARWAELPTFDSTINVDYLVHLQRQIDGIDPAKRLESRRLYEEGMAQFEAGNKREGLESFAAAATADPDCTDAQIALARVFNVIDNYNQAVWHAEQAFRAQPENLKARNILVASYFGKAKHAFDEREFSNSFDNCAKAVSIDPDDANIAEIVVLMSAVAENARRESEFVKICVALNPKVNPESDPRCFRMLGMAFIKLGRYMDAVPLLREFCERAPQDADCRAALVTALVGTGDFDCALHEIDTLAKSDADRAQELKRMLLDQAS
jgi:tetratricopeptide (TPR) repeat protein